MEIHLLTQEKIKIKFNEVIKDAKVIQGTVAYWTWDIDYTNDNFGTNFLKVLKKKNSFYCVDISSSTTDLFKIDKYYQKGCKFFVYAFKLTDTKHSEEKSISLLHSKMVYLQTLNKQFIFLGSHNNTGLAFDGKNMEHSVLLEFSLSPSKKDKIFLDDVLFQLERIKKRCVKYDPILLEYYKSLHLHNKVYKRIILKMNHDYWNLVNTGNSISIISYNNFFQNSNNNDVNISNEDLIIIILDNYYNKKIFFAKGKADDTVDKEEMDSKVTQSDFITGRIPEIQDPLGLPYFTIFTEKNSVISGAELNFLDHKIYRFKILNEIKNEKTIINIDKQKKIFNYWVQIDKDELKKFEFNGIPHKHILRIDEEKLNSEYLSSQKDEFFKDMNGDKFDCNTDDETREIIEQKIKEIFELLTKTKTTEKLQVENVGRKISFFVILNLLVDAIRKNSLLPIKKEKSIEELKKELQDFIKSKQKDNNRNFLNQFSKKYIVINDEVKI